MQGRCQQPPLGPDAARPCISAQSTTGHPRRSGSAAKSIGAQLPNKLPSNFHLFEVRSFSAGASNSKQSKHDRFQGA